MRWQLQLLLALVTVLLHLNQSDGSIADGNALLSIKEAVNNPKSLNRWLPNKDPCIPPVWLGVICNPAGRVRELSLNKLALQGQLSPKVGDLTDLEKLSLQGNKMTGHVPDELSQTRLKSLDVGNNLFYGPLENLFKNVPTLEFFYGQNNYFAGFLPSTLTYAQKLIVLNLNSNNFHGSIPDNIADLKSLVFLLLSDNLLGGSLPESLSSMTALRFLDLSNNSFTGPIPNGFGFSENLLNMDVSNNQLSGVIPAGLLAKQGFRYNGNRELTVPAGVQPQTEADTSAPLPTQGIPELTDPPATAADLGVSHSSSSSSGGIGAGGVVGIIIGVLAGIVLFATAVALFIRRQQTGYFPGLGGVWQSSQGSAAGAAGRWQPSWKSYQRISSTPRGGGGLPVWGGGLRTFSFDELAQATHDFSPECQQNIGAARSVFLGTLNSGEFVAVERLPGAVAQMQPEKEFISTVEVIAKLNHPHLVKLLGYCCQKHNRLLVMEHPTSGSLRDHLSGSLGDRAPLSWQQRLEAAVGVGSALHYLHNEGQVHGNVTPQAVFMDSFLKAKISSLSVRTKGHSNAVKDVEKALLRSPSLQGGVEMLTSPAGDVHKFGFLLLELFSGSSDNDRLAARWAALDTLDVNVVERHMDSRVGTSDCSLEALLKLLRAALSSVKPSVTDRPEISVVLDELRQALALLNKAREASLGTPPVTLSVPPEKPEERQSKDLMNWSPPRKSGESKQPTLELERLASSSDLGAFRSVGGVPTPRPSGGEQSPFSAGPLWSPSGPLGLGEVGGGPQPKTEAPETKPAWMLE